MGGVGAASFGIQERPRARPWDAGSLLCLQIPVTVGASWALGDHGDLTVPSGSRRDGVADVRQGRTSLRLQRVPESSRHWAGSQATNFFFFLSLSLSFFFFLVFIEVQLLYNIVFVSAVLQSESALRMHISPLYISFTFGLPKH